MAKRMRAGDKATMNVLLNELDQELKEDEARQTGRMGSDASNRVRLAKKKISELVAKGYRLGKGKGSAHYKAEIARRKKNG